MVVIRFKTQKARDSAWSRAGAKVGKTFYPKGFKGKWVGKKSLSFPNITKSKLKSLKIIN